VFFAFSAFVLAGLQRLPPAQGIAAMQSINVTAVRPVFMTVLFGTGVVAAAAAVLSYRVWGGRSALLLVAGAALYLLAAIVLTAAYHVPLNDSLAALDPQAPDAAARWDSYLSSWTAANHLRGLGCLAASAAFALALRW
jgi:uncharacterized membrane protein